MNDPFLTDRDGAEGLSRWREAPPGTWTRPGPTSVSSGQHGDPL